VELAGNDLRGDFASGLLELFRFQQARGLDEEIRAAMFDLTNVSFGLWEYSH
jgi:hypothetical protein